MKTIRLVIVALIVLTTTEVYSQVRFDINNEINSDLIYKSVDLSGIDSNKVISEQYDYILVKRKGKGKHERFIVYYANKDFTLISKKYNYYIKSYNFDDNHIGTYITETKEFGDGIIVVDGVSGIVIIDKSFNNINVDNYKYAN